MAHEDCVAFLKEALPRLGLSWPGHRRVHAQVCKRIKRRLLTLGLGDIAAYRGYLEEKPEEWDALRTLCHITISRFCRDRAVFTRLTDAIVPPLADAVASRGETILRAWSAGCASGEEPYSLVLIWKLGLVGHHPGISLSVVATDADAASLQRAWAGCYRPSSLRELPEAWITAAFDRRGPLYCLRESFRRGVAFHRSDIRAEMPKGPFDLVLCRNLVFTYFDHAGQMSVLKGMVDVLRPGGALVIGRGERLPPHGLPLHDWFPDLGIYRKQQEGR